MKKLTLPRLSLTRITMRPLDAEPRALATVRGASARATSGCDQHCETKLWAEAPENVA